MSPKAEAETMCRAGLDKDDLEVKFINSRIGKLHMIKNYTIFMESDQVLFFDAFMILLLNTFVDLYLGDVGLVCFFIFSANLVLNNVFDVSSSITAFDHIGTVFKKRKKILASPSLFILCTSSFAL